MTSTFSSFSLKKGWGQQHILLPLAGQLPQTPPPLLFVLSFMAHSIAFLSPRSVNRTQNSKCRSTSQRTKERGQLYGLGGFTPEPSTSGGPTASPSPSNASSEFHMAMARLEPPCPEPPSNWWVYVNNDQNSRLQRLPTPRTCTDSNIAQAEDYFITMFSIHST